MKKFLIKLAVCFLLAFCITIYLYRPTYQSIKLNDSISDINTELKRLDFPIKQELKEILDRLINVPIDRHELCLRNNNRVYLAHTDNALFKTPDISQTKEARELRVGAMAIEIYYSDGFEKDEIYRQIGQTKLCIPLISEKIQHYASSTALYYHIGLSRTDEFDFGERGKLSMTRIIGTSYIDTNRSSVWIVPNWYWFWLTTITLSIFLWKPIGWGWKYLSKVKV